MGATLNGHSLNNLSCGLPPAVLAGSAVAFLPAGLEGHLTEDELAIPALEATRTPKLQVRKYWGQTIEVGPWVQWLQIGRHTGSAMVLPGNPNSL